MLNYVLLTAVELKIQMFAVLIQQIKTNGIIQSRIFPVETVNGYKKGSSDEMDIDKTHVEPTELTLVTIYIEGEEVQ